jgi:hypothetical protein
MKKSILLSMAMMISVMIYAQHKEKDPAERAAHQTERMKSQLSLNDAQYASVKTINEKYAKKFSALRNDDAKQEKRNEVKSLKDLRQQEINAVLTPEQQQKWQAYREQKQEQGKAHRGERMDQRREDWKTALGLTDEQAKKMEAEQIKFHGLLKEIKANTTIDTPAKKLATEKVKQSHKKAVEEILTPDQFAKWKKIKREMKHNRKEGREEKGK